MLCSAVKHHACSAAHNSRSIDIYSHTAIVLTVFSSLKDRQGGAAQKTSPFFVRSLPLFLCRSLRYEMADSGRSTINHLSLSDALTSINW